MSLTDRALGHLVPCVGCRNRATEIGRLRGELERLLAVLNIREEQAIRMRAEIYELEADLMSGRTTWGAS